MNGVAVQRDLQAVEAAEMTELALSTYEVLLRSAASTPHAPALSFFRSATDARVAQTWTYRELLGKITQVANLFHRLGATKQTVIAVALPNLLETHAVIWGAQAAGIVLPLNTLLEPAALANLLEVAGAEIFVTLRGADVWQRLGPELARSRALKHVVLIDPDPNPTGGDYDMGARPALADASASSPQLHDFASSIAGESADELVSRRVFSASDASSWFCTGGTTGRPKLAMRTHANELFNAWSVAQVLGGSVAPGKVLFCGLPLFHVNAVLATGLLPLSRGAHVVIGTPLGYRSPELIQRFWEIVAHYRVSLFSGVPTLFSSLLQVPIGSHDISSLEYGICGAAPMPAGTFRAFEQRTGVKILEGYGLTEGTCVSSLNPPCGLRRVGSVGLPVPGQAMKTIVVNEHGGYVRDCGVDEVGLVVVSGPNVFLGYHRGSGDQHVWVDCGDGRRWLDTGDLGRRDLDGYFWLTGRKKEVIIRGGHNLDPAVVEEALARHPAVALAAAVGRPDAYAGEVPVAYVQLRQNAQTTREELLAYLRGELAERAALPKDVRILDAIPLTAVGKIFKPALKYLEAKEALETALREGGVAFSTLVVVDEATRGMVAELTLAQSAQQDAARATLEKFAIPFTIVTHVS